MSSIEGSRNSYAAALVASVGYGFYLLLAGQCMYRLIVERQRKPTRSVHFLIAYAALLFSLETVYFIAGSKWSSIEFVETQQDPGVFASQLFGHLTLLKNVVYTINLWLADGFILYRTFVVLGPNALVLLPTLLYLGSLATGIGLLVESAKPGALFGQAAIINFGTPFWSLSVAMNILATVLIGGRIYYSRQRSSIRFRAQLTNFAILAESAALYAVAAILYIPMFARNITLQYPFSALMGVVIPIAPTLIILRMANGQALTRHWDDAILLQEQPGTIGAHRPSAELTKNSSASAMDRE